MKSYKGLLAAGGLGLCAAILLALWCWTPLEGTAEPDPIAVKYGLDPPAEQTPAPLQGDLGKMALRWGIIKYKQRNRK